MLHYVPAPQRSRGRASADVTRRSGRIVGKDFVFEESGKSTLRFQVQDNGALMLTWTSQDQKTHRRARLRTIGLPTVIGVTGKQQ
ncbi:hypothetical protein C4568_00195 [Candidatus Parcubacteria bacterium]|nr:MAG: hypothetical protein C4568_00195 [Candidatus Parcubacteria bacterium]